MFGVTFRLLQIDSIIEEREDRFRYIFEVETDRFIEKMRNKNTKRKTICDAKLLHFVDGGQTRRQETRRVHPSI